MRLPGTLLFCLLIFGTQQLFAQPQQCISYLNGKEWRLYCPFDTSDELLFATTVVPQYISWSHDFADVYFVTGTTLFTAPWKLGASARRITSVPKEAVSYCQKNCVDSGPIGNPFAQKANVPSQIDRVWKDPQTGAIGLVALKTRPGEVSPTSAVFYTKRTDLEPWLLAGRRKTDCESDEGMCGRIFASPRGVVFLSDQLMDMSVGRRMDEHIPGADRSDDGGQYRLPALTAPGSVIITNVEVGDTEHAMSPLNVELKGGKKLELKACEEPQLSFKESSGFLLLGSEATMECPTLINLSSGELKALPKGAHAAVWVPRPPKF